MTVISTRRSYLPSVDDGRDHTSVTFDGGEAHLEQVCACPFMPRPMALTCLLGRKPS
jgi:hypothetical protein